MAQTKKSILNRYPGNKSIHGLFQFIINRIPPHKIYWELFAGSGTIARILPDAAFKTLVDVNPLVIQALSQDKSLTANFICMDVLQFLLTMAPAVQTYSTVPAGNDPWTTQTGTSVLPATVEAVCTGQLPGSVQTEITVPVAITIPDRFIYADPPYRFINRRSKRRLYTYQMTDMQHEELVFRLSKIECSCMISHPENDMYDKYLKGWTKEKFTVSYQGQTAQECIYYNYLKPSVLQTYQFVGSDCWDRQRVKRKITRLANKLMELPELERNAVINRVLLHYSQK